MKLTPTAKKFLQALRRLPDASYAELGARAALTDDEVDRARRELLRVGCIELRPALTNRGEAAMRAA